MSEEEMQELQNRVVESIQDYFDSYDWDRKFVEHFGDQKLHLFVSHSQ